MYATCNPCTSYASNAIFIYNTPTYLLFQLDSETKLKKVDSKFLNSWEMMLYAGYRDVLYLSNVTANGAALSIQLL
jgi:hypothetical protein